MPSVDPAIEPMLTALVNGLRGIGVPFWVVGALVHELLLDEPMPTKTNDADVVVMVHNLELFDAVKKGLAASGFSSNRMPHRLVHRDGGLVDILPYSKELVPDGKLQLDPDRVMNMAGFEHLANAGIEITLDSGLVVPIAPLPLYALLKLVAFTDRKQPKDTKAVAHVLRYYATDDERRWGLEHDGVLVEHDYSTAYLLGKDGAGFLNESLIDVLNPLLDDLTDGAEHDDDDVRQGSGWRPSQAQMFLWYRRGLGV